ncbi:MAG: hypothetical protein GAK28_00291 [Luteibacter sp.]|uniref:cupin domain-containing protein n=1 Tax=Luteibacter sp. TaxID=1886636 RepID=UPI00137F5107|nr:cupin domain-containing protein [Luteibacter sp.]KAF1009651.1 MAG: hypothetical protein GAK28_00291 [Luteibacter sp.]
MRLKKILPILLLLPVASMAYGETTNSAKVDVLVKSDHSWNGIPYQAYPSGRPELTVLKFHIPAHTALPWHTHPIPNAGYVLSGEITVEDQATGKKQTYTAGQAFTESVGSVHRGVTGDQPVELIVTYSGTAGTPTFVAEKGQKPEY